MNSIFSDVDIAVFNIGNFEESNARPKMPMHHHTSIEVSYVVSGELILTYVDKKTNTIKTEHIFSNQFSVVKPDCLHCTDVPSALKTVGVEFVSKNKPIIRFLKDSRYVGIFPAATKFLQSEKEVFVFNGSQTLAKRLLALEKFFNNDEPNPSIYDQAQYEVAIKNLFIELLQCCEKTTDKVKYNIYINRAISYINTNYHKSITITSLAKHLNISDSYLQKLFKNELHSTVLTELNKIRIEKSKNLLTEQNYTTVQTARSVGFNSSQSFIASFKKYVGITPTRFKQDYLERSIIRIKQSNNFKEEKVFTPPPLDRA